MPPEELSVEPRHRQRQVMSVAAERNDPVGSSLGHVGTQIGEHVVGNPDHQRCRELVRDEIRVPQRHLVRGLRDIQLRCNS
ncbi:hypothetical protein [Kribbella rubisoli]|uniref:hypothetical protein n=1 Tax=Kribbella rubisoli TaxID=3075929 RepID=UPI00102B0C8C|nr:hypothetical protein [Kribbella rubisoli]